MLCPVCEENLMTEDQESIAAGNNYKQLGNLKPLNGTNWNACVLVWLHKINVQIQVNHLTNYGIAFPMNCQVECLKKLPCIDVNHWPQVLFLGPWDEWCQVAGKYKYLYGMDTEIAYDWLLVWVNLNHQVLKIASLIHLIMFVRKWIM